MSKKKPTAFRATHTLEGLLLQAAAEMEAQNAWNQNGERPTDVARAFVALLFEGQGQPIKDDFTEEMEAKAYHSAPEIMGGTPVFRGTRVPVACLFDYLEAGESIDVFLDQYPTVAKEAAIDSLQAAKRLLEEDAHFIAELAR
jgi:uncharacterized protein (DUF433 family)